MRRTSAGRSKPACSFNVAFGSIVLTICCGLFVGCAAQEASPGPQAHPDADVGRVSTRAHPYLFFSAEDLPAIRQRAEEYPASFFWSRLKEKAAPSDLNVDLLREIGRVPNFRQTMQADHMCRSALVGLLTGSEEHLAKAKEALLALAKWRARPGKYGPQVGHMFQFAAIAYDWLYNELSEPERLEVETFLARAAGVAYTVAKERQQNNWWFAGRPGRQMSHQPIMYSGIGLIGLALYDKHPDAKTWVAEATGVMKEVMEENFDADGAAYEAYTTYMLYATLTSIYPTMDAIRRVTGEDLFDHADSVLYKSTCFTAYMLMPDRNELLAYGAVGGRPSVMGLQLLKNATEFDDGLAAWYLDMLIKRNWNPSDGHLVWGVLWARKVAPENPDASTRLSEAFAYNNSTGKGKWNFGAGHVFLRTGFTDANDIQFALKAGVDGLGHGAPDKGGINLNAYGERFLRREMWKRGHKSNGHNFVLIDGAAQGTAPPSVRIANVDTLESHKGYDYVKLDLTQAYRQHPDNVDTRKSHRHVVFVRTSKKTGYFVVIDDVQRDANPHTYSHGLYYDPKQVRVASAEGNRVVISGVEASLHIAAVHPATMTATREDRDGRPYAMLTNTEKVVRFVLVTVMYPARSGESVPKFEPAADGDKVGVVIAGTKILYDKSSGKVSVSGNLSDVVARGHKPGS